MFWHGPKRDSEASGVLSRSYGPGVRSVRRGIDGVKVSDIGLGESLLMWHHLRPPSPEIASTLTGALINKVVLVSWQPGFYFYVFISFV